MRTTSMLALVFLLLAGPAGAQSLPAPLQDLVDTITEETRQAPAEQPTPTRPVPPSVAPVEPPPVPKPRPPSLPEAPAVEAPEEAELVEEDPEPPAEEALAPATEPVATDAPERVYQVACPAVLTGLVEAEMAPPISEGVCGEQSPLVVTAVWSRGRMVPLSAPVTTNCPMASALPRWLEMVDGYAAAMLESPLAAVSIGTGYQCRQRVGGEQSSLSEHGFANAVDVSGFTLESGAPISVASDWDRAEAPEGRLLRLAHDAACSGFTTVLGPEANAEHEDHLHFDLGCHGASCTAQICE